MTKADSESGGGIIRYYSIVKYNLHIISNMTVLSVFPVTTFIQELLRCFNSFIYFKSFTPAAFRLWSDWFISLVTEQSRFIRSISPPVARGSLCAPSVQLEMTNICMSTRIKHCESKTAGDHWVRGRGGSICLQL